MVQRNKVTVKIAGKDYTLVGIESDEYIQRVGLYIDKKMNEINNMYTKLSTSMIAVLTATNIADDYFKAHESEINLKNNVRLLQDDLEKVKREYKELVLKNTTLHSQNTHLQLELAKREAELGEVRKK